MRIKLDENIPTSARRRLATLGHDVDTVVEESLSGAADEVVWSAAQDAARFLVTQDLDFSDIRRFAPGTHCGILLVRLPDEAQLDLAEYLGRWLADSDVEAWRGCFVVATPTKIRVRRPTKRVRPVELRDLEAVRDVLVETWHHTYDPIMGAARVSEITDSWHSIAHLRGEIDRAAYAFLLVEVDGAVVATGSASRTEDVAVVHRLYVRPNHQGQGFGTALLDALVGQLGPAARVELNVDVANARAIAFYEQRGFAISGTDGDDVVMHRS